MGLFGGKSDSKARIEELKRKIQAEQQALQSSGPVQPPQPPATAPPPAPAPQAAWQPPAQPAPVQAAPPRQQYAPAPAEELYEEEQPRYARPAPRRRLLEPEELIQEEPMEEIKTGIILDLGEGMSLNLPIRSRMRLDEFLHIADRVRELQRLQHPGQY